MTPSRNLKDQTAFCCRPQVSGNMLIYILGTIFLVGLLIVVVKGNFQEGAGIDAEKNMLLVTRVQNYGAELERAVKTIVQTNGFSEADIRFGNDIDTAYGLITDIPARQVFSPDGGGAEYRAAPDGVQVAASNIIFIATNAVDGIGTTCSTNTCVDLISVIKNVTKEFCLSLNNQNGIDNPSGDAPVETGGLNMSTAFNGNYTYQNLINTGTSTFGYSEACISYAGVYYYYRVLLAR